MFIRLTTECLVLSSDFKLLDESQVLLRVPKKDNIYSVDLKSVVPTGGLTCLIAKAKIDESNTWHMMLGHINFKTMNKLVKGNLVKGTKENIVAGQAQKEKEPKQEDAGMKPTEVDENEASDKSGKHDQATRSESKRQNQREMKTEHTNNTNNINTVSTPVSTAGPSFDTTVPLPLVNTAGPSGSTANAFEEHLFERFSLFKNAFTLPPVPNVSSMNNTGIFGNPYDDEDVEEEVDMNNNKKMKEAYVKSKARLIERRVCCQPRSFEDPHFPDKVYKVEKALYGLHQASRAWYETLSTYLPDNGFYRGQIDKTLFIKRHKDDILLVQVYVDDIIFGSTKKEMSTGFEKLMHDKFQMSSMGELSFFLGLQVQQKSDGIFISQDKYVAEILKKFDFALVKTASTPMETNKALIKDEEAEDVDVHLYRSMIGSLMYLTASRPDIMFVVCACARFQVTPKTSHLNAVKRIFRYLKGQPKLGLWYPRDSPFDLEAFSDSDYARASLDKKSTTGGCQFLGKRLISWQCKKQTIVANSTTEAEYVAAANCLKNPVFHSKTKYIEIRNHFIRDSYKKKLIQVIKIHTDQNVPDLLIKAFDASSTLMETNKALIKDEEAKDVDVNLYRSMIGSLNEVVQYLAGGCQFLGKRLISWQCKKQTIVANSTTEAEYVAAANCCKSKEVETPRYLRLVVLLKKVGDEAVYKELGDRMERAATTASSLEAEQDSGSGPSSSKNEEIEITANIDGRVKTITEESIRRHLKLEDSDGIPTLPTAKNFEQLALIGPKKTAWEQFSSNIATAIICLETNRTFNFSKMIFEVMRATKLTYGTAYTKLILRVKKLEHKVKASKSRRRTKIAVSNDEEVSEDPSKHGRIIAEIDQNPSVRY
ncbi:putative ribonuclease H-like domain-containing protein [Tanacetum coccineum]